MPNPSFDATDLIKTRCIIFPHARLLFGLVTRVQFLVKSPLIGPQLVAISSVTAKLVSGRLIGCITLLGLRRTVVGLLVSSRG